MVWTWAALAFAALSALVAIAAAITAYRWRPLQEDPSRPGLYFLGKYGKVTFALALLAPFLAAVSAGLSAVSVLANA